MECVISAKLLNSNESLSLNILLRAAIIITSLKHELIMNLTVAVALSELTVLQELNDILITLSKL
jgi:hypothetical protein